MNTRQEILEKLLQLLNDASDTALQLHTSEEMNAAAELPGLSDEYKELYSETMDIEYKIARVVRHLESVLDHGHF